MFDFDAGKLIVFGIVALAVIPPKDLPRVMRTVGKYVATARRMASDFQGQLMTAMKEAELESVKQEIASMNEATKIDTSFDPTSLMRDSMEKAVETPAAEPTAYETVTVEPPAPPPEPILAEMPPPAPEKAASSAT